MDIDIGDHGKFSHRDWTLPDFKRIINRTQTFAHQVDGWNALFLENHDQPRSVSRFTPHSPKHQDAAAKVLATLLCTLGGTLFVYEGQNLAWATSPNLGAPNNIKMSRRRTFCKSKPSHSFSDLPRELTMCVRALETLNGDGKAMEQLWAEVQLKARDNGRSPVQVSCFF